MQEQFTRTHRAFFERPAIDNCEAYRELETLKGRMDDKGEIVKQLAIFAASPVTHEGRPLEARAILDGPSLPPEIIIRVLAPYLDTDNENLRSFVRDWFQWHDSCGSDASSLHSLNYEDYLTYARIQLNIKEELPTAFVEYIYERSPERALMVFLRANPCKHAETTARLRAVRERLEADRQQLESQGPDAVLPPDNTGQRENKGPDEIFMAEKIISHAISLKNWEDGKLLPEARDQLARLAENDPWRVRLYVAHIMQRHREVRLPEVLQKLRVDENLLVRKAAKFEKS